MVHQDAPTEVTFRLFRPAAGRVEVRGTFTGWERQPLRMRPVGGGWFEARLSLSPGDYEFGYLIDGTEWLADFAANGVKPGALGGWLSLLNVQAEERVTAPIRLTAQPAEPEAQRHSDDEPKRAAA